MHIYLGVKKSGTSDLYTRLMAHREFQVPRYKESQWFPRIRFGGSNKKGKTVFKGIKKYMYNNKTKDESAASVLGFIV
jgi:hypothetical protein